jgi:hypothetical protein
MQNTTDISALLQNTRNIYIAIAVLTVIVGLEKARRTVAPGSATEAPVNPPANELLA